LIIAALVLPALLFGAWLLSKPKFETLTTHRDGDRIYMVDASGHRIAGNRYTQTLRDGDTARCRVRRFPILMDPVIEGCKPAAHAR
jgi:hypothetical protein